FSIGDLDYQFACFQAWNDWMADFCKVYEKRLFAVALIPTEPIERAVAEMQRTAGRGLRSAMMSVLPEEGKGYNSTVYDPVWSASEDLGMPISLHLAASKRSFSLSGNSLVDFSLGFTPAMYSVALMIFSGVFDRH